MEIFSEEENEKRLKTNTHKLSWTSQTCYLNVEVIECNSVSPEKIHRIFWKETDAEKAFHLMWARPLRHLKSNHSLMHFSVYSLIIFNCLKRQHHFFFLWHSDSVAAQKHHSPAQQTCVSISCSCRIISFVADPSILCSSIKEKCSMLLIDSFSCRVWITSFQTEEHLLFMFSTANKWHSANVIRNVFEIFVKYFYNLK